MNVIPAAVACVALLSSEVATAQEGIQSQFRQKWSYDVTFSAPVTLDPSAVIAEKVARIDGQDHAADRRRTCAQATDPSVSTMGRPSCAAGLPPGLGQQNVLPG